MFAAIRILVLLLSFSLSFSDAALSEETTNPPRDSKESSLEDVIPLTVGNLRGHQMLYDEGFMVISSSKKALEYAGKTSILSSKEAIKEAARRYAEHSAGYKEAVTGDIKESVVTGRDVAVKGTSATGKILRKTHSLAKSEMLYSKEGFSRAWDRFILGNITLAKRTEEDRAELAGIPGDYFRNLKSDFSNIWEITGELHELFAGRIEVGWDKAFQKAGDEFRSEYERSGEESNSIAALGHILYGYLKAVYQGIAVPSSKVIVKGVSAGTAGGIFLPVATTTVVAGRTIQSVGLTVYYTGKTGIKIVSPTVEAGILSGMSMLSAGAVPVTYAGGGALGAVNQIAFTAAAPIAATGEAATKTTVHTGVYVGFLAYDGIKGTTKVVINQAKSGIVLGYNALTALPAHAVMGVVDTAVILAWDGPRLIIASVKGEIRQDKEGKGFSAGDLPVGTVVDVERLRDTRGMEVEVISEDPAVIRDVLQKFPCDLRGNNENCE